MNRHISHFDQNEEERNESQNASLKKQEGLEFSSPEEMLRHDAAQTKLPPGIIHRLQQSAPRKSWWQRLWSRE